MSTLKTIANLLTIVGALALVLWLTIMYWEPMYSLLILALVLISYAVAIILKPKTKGSN